MKPDRASSEGLVFTLKFPISVLLVVDVNNVKKGKEASEVTEGKSSRMRWGR